LSKQIDASINEFCDLIAKKYSLDKDELYGLWMDDESSPSPKKTEKDSVVDITPEKVMNSTKDFLMAYCKSKGMKQSGKKDEIIQRVLDSLKKVNSTPTKVVKTVKQESSVLSSVAEKSGTNEIRKNKFGNYEHYESGLVFNNETKMVIGHQNANGKIDSLTDKDIEMCKKFKFQYKLPENLSVNKGLQNVKVDELEEEDEELDEDDIDEEEEDLDNEVDLEDD